MQLFTTVLAAVLPLFGLVAIGYCAKKLRILHVTDADVLSRFVVGLALPAFVIDAFLHNTVKLQYFSLPLVIWVSAGVAFALTLVAAKLLKCDLKQTGTMLLLATFGNTGFLGYPITMALHPNLIPANVIMDQIGMSTPLYPIALLVAGVYGRTSETQTMRESMIRVFRTPIFNAVLIALALRFVPWPHLHGEGAMAVVAAGVAKTLHAIVVAIHWVSSATIPVILVSIGLLLRPSAIRDHIGNVAVIGILRLIVAPALGFLTARYILGIHDPALLTICVIISGTPPSAAATVLCGQYDMDGSLGVAAFFALTMLSALSIPLMLSILH
ncbi:MAG TPA: AEC family transporter [Capsulimonadaceae bacterium]